MIFPHFLSQFLHNGLGLHHILNKILLRMCDLRQLFLRLAEGSPRLTSLFLKVEWVESQKASCAEAYLQSFGRQRALGAV